MSSGKIILGLLAGVAAGAVLGILFAPDKGSDTRKKISKKKDDYLDTLNEKFDEFIENVTEKFSKVKEDVSEFTDLGKAQAEQEKKDAKAYSS